MTRLKQMRIAANISQNELARRLGVTCPSVNNMEKKGIYHVKTAIKYSKILKCPPIFLLEGLDIVSN